MAAKILDMLRPAAQRTQPFPELSPREYEVLTLLADNLGNQAISRQLNVSPKTVANAVSTILVKLHVQDRTQAMAKARAAGLGIQSST